MIRLENEMLLYHGSYIGIPRIDLDRCFGGLDFGRGFYLTSSYEQACGYVRLSVRKAMRLGSIPENFAPEDGCISVYRFRNDPALLAHCFQGADIEWLHFVAANRKADLFPRLLKKYAATDIVGGKIANDRTARTLQMYISGVLGEPGAPETDGETIRRLLPNRLEDQYCFRTQKAIDHLEFIRSDRYGDVQ